MRTIITSLALLALSLASIGPSSALASKNPPPPTGTLDQQYTAATDGALAASSVQSVAQTYTAGLSGSLLSVSLSLGIATTKPKAGLQVSIYDAAGGLPVGPALYTSALLTPRVASYPNSTWVTVAIPAGVVAQVPGNSYAIVLTSAASGSKVWDWFDSAAAGYVGGQPDTLSPANNTWVPAAGYGGVPLDLDFQTYVG
jgi:hypothetical protein